MTYTLSPHIIEQARAKDIPLAKIQEVLKHGRRANNPLYPNQARYIGQGIAVVVDELNKTAITVYLDQVKTPLRPDQIERGVKIERG
jgi:hypothetical protein